MTPELLRIVDRRLEQTAALQHPWSLLVLGACEGPETLNAVLAGNKPATTAAIQVTAASAAPSAAPGAYLESITVEGFRGIGAKRTLELQPGPGLTLVIGRNGSATVRGMGIWEKDEPVQPT